MTTPGGRWHPHVLPNGTTRQDWVPEEQPASPDGSGGEWRVVVAEGNRWEWVPATAATPAEPPGRRKVGFVKRIKSEAIAKEAQRALDEGATLFTPMLNTPSTAATLTGSVPGWSEMIESIEAVGWQLEHWAIGQDGKGRPQAYPLFRRS